MPVERVNWRGCQALMFMRIPDGADASRAICGPCRGQGTQSGLALVPSAGGSSGAMDSRTMTNPNQPAAIDRPTTWDAWGETERDLCMAILQMREDVGAAREALEAALGERLPEPWTLVDHLETAG